MLVKGKGLVCVARRDVAVAVCELIDKLIYCNMVAVRQCLNELPDVWQLQYHSSSPSVTNVTSVTAGVSSVSV